MEKSFLEFVASVFKEDVGRLSLDTEYKRYDKWDSLMMLTLVMELEAEYGISISIENLGKINTLADLYELVK